MQLGKVLMGRRENIVSGGKGPFGGRLPLPEFKKITQKVFPCNGQDRFWMELHSFEHKFLVPGAHDFTTVCPCAYFKTGGDALLPDEERMVPCGFKRVGQTFEYCFAVMVNQGSLSVHEPGRAHDLSAEGSSYRLMPEADAEYREPACEMPDRFNGYASLIRRAGAR